jgi:hypothetical protein
MRKVAAMMLAVFAVVLCATGKQKQENERLRVHLSANCDVPAGEVVESSLRESIRSSSGYVLADEEEAGEYL